jgi:heme/copper-type cytochrome/quinol oxidase subunit 3
LTLLDVRRGFLFPAYSVRTLFYVFTPIHGVMLAAGVAGMIACYRGVASRERRLPDTSRYVNAVAFVIFALLVIDLFAYRGVPAARSMAPGRVNADWLQAGAMFL